MSAAGDTVSLPYVRTDLAGGLAKCTKLTARQRPEEDGPVLSTTGSQYSLPIAETKRRLPIRPPLPASVMHRSSDLCFPKISHSHAVHVAPTSTLRISPSLQSAGDMNATHFHISADRRLETCNTTTRENFQPAQRVTPAVMVRKRAAENSKFTPCSANHEFDDWSPTYSSTFRPHSSVCHAARRERHIVTKNAGCCPITGRHSVTCSTSEQFQRGSGETTTNSATYRSYKIQDSGYRSDPPRHQKVSSIPHGDPDKVAQPRTTNRDTFQSPQPTTGSVYSRSTAVSGTLASSVHLGGTPQIDTFFTTVRDTFPCPVAQAGRKGQGNIERIPRNASFLPQGDLDAGRVKERISLSTTGTTHGVPPPHSYPAHMDSSRLHTASSIYFGCQQQPQIPSSTMTTSYLPLTTRTHRVGAPVRDNVPLNYYPGHLCGSTAASSYRTHSGDLRHNLAPSTLRNLKRSHWQLSN